MTHHPPRPSHDDVAMLPADRQPELRMMTMPADANPAGDVFGGWIMSHADVAGAIAAHRLARGRVVTVAVNAFTFRQPVSVGDVVSFYVAIVQVGRTSITVDVEVYAERDPAQPKVVKVTEATLTYVALDDKGNKRPVCPDSGGA
jgi:acyl-CoA thioesterase YciA